MPDLYNVSNWNPQPWYNTGGTRAKKYLQAPDGSYYYFKRSQLKPGKDYKFEFWSEIIASEVGELLEFNVLRYDIAIDDQIMGCISQSMIDSDKEELIEGIKYLQAFDYTFNPENVKQRYLYNFHLIEEALSGFGLDNFINTIIEIIIFDSIIGNSDRHQENWAFINDYNILSKNFRRIETLVKEKGFEQLPSSMKEEFRDFIDPEKKELTKEGNAIKLLLTTTKSAAPIYDNGSSLGRELLDEKISRMLGDPAELHAYINKGLSEIHWENKKLDHFTLIKQILDTSHREIVINVIRRVISLFDGTKIAAIVNEIDILVPEHLFHYRLPKNRKQLIIKMIILRVARLEELIK